MPSAVHTPIRPVGIRSVGHYLPVRRLKNDDLEALGNSAHPEWIVQKTGIHARHVADDSEALSDLIIPAAKAALTAGGLEANDLDAVIVAGDNHDTGGVRLTSTTVAKALGLESVTVYDIRSGCPGSVLALHLGVSLVASGLAARTLVTAGEVNTRGMNWAARSAVWFGDGAGAVVVEPCRHGTGILATLAAGSGDRAEILEIPAGGSREPVTAEGLLAGRHQLHMDAPAVFPFAVEKFIACIEAVTAHVGLKPVDLDLVIPHQANLRIIEAAAQHLGLRSQQVFVNLDRVGNTGAASVLLALSEAVAARAVKPGDLVVTVGFGGGLAWGAQLIRYNGPDDFTSPAKEADDAQRN